MKKYLLTVCLLATTLVASAQFATSSGSSMGATSSVEEWSGFRFSYVPTTLEFDDDWDTDDWDFKGFSLEYVKGFGIMDNMPLFLEVGAGIEWLNWSESDSEDEDYYEYEWKESLNIFSVSVPVNLGYKVALNENLTIMPYVGLKARIGLSATLKGSYEVSYDGETEEDEETLNLYNKDDTDDETLKRFLLGWQIGATATYNNLSFGVNFGSCFTDEIINEIDKCKLSSTTITVGINF